MINVNRVVPIQKMDLLTMIGTVLTIANVSYTPLQPTDIIGDFSVTGSGSAGTFLASQPVQTLDFPSGVTGATVYFIPGYAFTGITVAGATPTLNSGSLEITDVVPDGVTLYKAVLASNKITITAVSPVVSA